MDYIPSFTRDWRVATMDFGGMGDNDWRSRYTAIGFAREVLAVIDAARLSPTIVVAHSFGGDAAAHASLMAAERFRRLIIVDTRLMVDVVAEPTPRESQAFIKRPRFYSTRNEVLARYRPIPRIGPVDPLIWQNVASQSIKQVEDRWV